MLRKLLFVFPREVPWYLQVFESFPNPTELGSLLHGLIRCLKRLIFSVCRSVFWVWPGRVGLWVIVKTNVLAGVGRDNNKKLLFCYFTDVPISILVIIFKIFYQQLLKYIYIWKFLKKYLLHYINDNGKCHHMNVTVYLNIYLLLIILNGSNILVLWTVL